MTENACNDDGQPLTCSPGYVGITPDVPIGLEQYLYSSEDCYSLEDEINGTCDRPTHLPTAEEMFEQLVANLPESGAAT